MWQEYSIGLLLVFIAAAIAFFALVIEKDDLHRLLLLDLVEVPSLGIIALLGTDLAEALILPGLVVGIAELLALSQIYVTKEGLRERNWRGLLLYGKRTPGTFRTPGDGKWDILGYLDLCFLCLHVHPGVLAPGTLHGSHWDPPEGDSKDVPCRDDVG